MKTWLEALDAILRGEVTRVSQVHQGLGKIPIRGLTILIILLGSVYGMCMGVFSLLNREHPQTMQIIASMIKVPVLYLLTILVTLPSLYVFNALVGSRLGFMTVIRLLVASLAITLSVLASFGPIVAFFSLTTTSYPFIKLMNVAVFALSGVLGLGFLLQTLHRLNLNTPKDPSSKAGAPTPAGARLPGEAVVLGQAAESPRESSAGNPPAESTPAEGPPQESTPSTNPAPSQPETSTETPLPTLSSRFQVSVQPQEEDGPRGALDFIPYTSINENVRRVFVCWVVLFALVGAQMSWVLRPFIGAPDRDFEWFRTRQSNFFDAVFRAILDLFR